MRSILLCLIISLSLPTGAQAQHHDIFPADAPQVIPLWHRVADFSPRLRAVEACALSPDGRLAVSGSKFGYNVMLWRVADGALLWEGHHESEVECVAFSPDGKRVATGGEDFFLRVWEVATGRELFAYETSGAGFDGLAWSPDGSIIVGGDEAGNAIVIDAATYRERWRLNCGSTINSLDFTESGKRMVVGGNIQTPDPTGPGGNRYEGFAKIIDLESRRVVDDFGRLAGSVKSVRYSADESLVATGGFDNAVRLFRVADGALLREIVLPGKVEAVAFSPDGHYLVAGGHDRAIYFYRLTDGALALTLPSARTEYLDFSADGRLLLTGHEDSGLLSCYLLLSDTQARGNYQQIADEQLNNRDLKPKN